MEFGIEFQALSGLDKAISTYRSRLLGNASLDATLNAQFLVQIGVFTAVPMIMGFILELGLIKVIILSLRKTLNFFCLFHSIW
jgi:callose synthase